MSGSPSAAVNALVFDFRGADNVTLDHLSMTGAATAVYANYTTDSDNVTISANDIFGNADTGIFVGSDNDAWTVGGNRVHDTQAGGRTGSGINITGNWLNLVVRDNVVFNNPRYGITLTANYGSGTVSGNEAYGNGTGILSNVGTMSGNIAHHNTTGIYVEQSGSLGFQSIALNNLVYSNVDGIVVSPNAGFPPSIVDGNRVYNNSAAGIAGGANSIVRNNTIYSNKVGMVAPVASSFGGGQVYNNVVYANSDKGIVAGGTGVRLTNNTVYQFVGDAIRIQGASNIGVYGNVLWVEAGADLYVAADGQAGFKSDGNLLHHGAGPQAATGFWGGAARLSLADWKAASGQDVASAAGNPAFVDVDGADNILGYNPVGNGYDGGSDDDFYLLAGSPAIDHGFGWSLTATDLEGFGRVDDPGSANAGSPDYAGTVGASSQFVQSGTLALRANNTYFNFDLPFAFPFYDGSFTRVTVSTEGFLQFAGPDAPFNGGNTDAEFIRNRRAAPLWDNVNVGGATDGVFIERDRLGAGEDHLEGRQRGRRAAGEFLGCAVQ